MKHISHALHHQNKQTKGMGWRSPLECLSKCPAGSAYLETQQIEFIERLHHRWDLRRSSNLTLKCVHLPIILRFATGQGCPQTCNLQTCNFSTHIEMTSTLKDRTTSSLLKSEFWSSDGRTHGQTQSDAYEPTMHMHRCAQKQNPILQLRLSSKKTSMYFFNQRGSIFPLPFF